MPTQIERMQVFYLALDGQAESIGENKLFKGYVSKVYKELKLPMGSYSRMLTQLQQMGCISILRRGARDTQSEWLLHTPPTEELYDTTDFDRPPAGTTIVKRVEELERKVQQLERRIR